MTRPLVFVSWSGAQGQRGAQALQRLIGGLLPSVELHLARQDRWADQGWPTALIALLERARFAVVCADSAEPGTWALFEAGACAARLAGSGRLALFWLGPGSGPPPLAWLPAPSADESGARALAHQIARATDQRVEELDAAFDGLWPELRQELAPDRERRIGQDTGLEQIRDLLLAQGERLEGLASQLAGLEPELRRARANTSALLRLPTSAELRAAAKDDPSTAAPLPRYPMGTRVRIRPPAGTPGVGVVMESRLEDTGWSYTLLRDQSVDERGKVSLVVEMQVEEAWLEPLED